MSQWIGCECRKPRPGAPLAAAKLLNIDLRESYMVCELWPDTDASKRPLQDQFLRLRLPKMFLVHSLKCRIRTNIDEEGQELPIIGVGVFDISFVVNSL
jgi:hypothetical protein